MKRFTITHEGYNIEEVNRFIDIVIKRLEKLNNDNSLLQMKISSLEEELKKEKISEAKVSEAILAAQQTSDRIKSLAREEANVIVEEARNNANSIIHEALLTAEKTEREALILKKNITVYKNRVKNIIKSQLEIADDLDKYDLDN
ncbi:MAG: DivIVA domain-containing protein [Bacilli bacterium]|nr:DivIVA domain-containing protein [Bacilli bacterium]